MIRLRRLSLIDNFPTTGVIGLVLSILGLTVILGWFSNNILLIQILPQFVPMQFNTALCFLLSGIGVALLPTNNQKTNNILGGVVSGFGLFTLLEYVFNINIGIDQFFIKHSITVLTTNPGRMSPNTAMCFFIAGVNLILATKVKANNIFFFTFLAFSSLITALGVIAFFGYPSQIETTYALGYLSQMAIHTSIGFIVLGLGQFIWLLQVISFKKIYIQFLILPVGIGILATSLILWQAIKAEELNRLQFDISVQAKQLERSFIQNSDFSRSINSLEVLWQESVLNNNINDFEDDATNYVNAFAAVKAIGHSNADFVIDAFTFDSNNQQYSAEEIRNLPEYQELILTANNSPAFEELYSRPVLSDEGGFFYILLHPFNNNGAHNGFLISILDASEFIDSILAGMNNEYFKYSIYDNKELIYQDINLVEINIEKDTNFIEIEQANRKLLIEISPSTLYLNSYTSSIKMVFLIGGVLLALVGMMITWLIHKIEEKNLLQREILLDKENTKILYSQEEARYRSIFNTVLDGIIIINYKGIIQNFNPQAEKIFGFPHSEVVGKNISCLMPTQHADQHDAFLSNAYETGETRILGKGRVLLAQRKDKSTLPVRIRVSEIYSQGERMFTGVITDISSELENEKKLTKKNQELEYSNQALKQFAYVASHDLQEPLRVVASYAQLLSQRYEGKLDEKADKFIDFIVDGAERMQSMIKSLLRYSQVEMGPLELGAAPLLESLQIALNNLEKSIDENDCKIIYDAESFPNVIGDTEQLSMIFQNLISNAIKYRSDKTPEIQITSEKHKGYWHITVKDNGMGFEEKHAKRIFEIFQRLHSNHHSEGNGIGLAICSKIIERHGGQLSATSSPGIGSEFTFTLIASSL